MKHFRDFNKNILAVIAVLTAVMLFAPQASAYDIKQVWTRFSATAGEDLTLGDIVCLAAADGYAYQADADLTTRRPAIGIVGKTTASGSLVEIITRGIFTGWSSLTVGAPAFISSTVAAATQTAVGTYQQMIGVAVSSTDYLFDFQANTASATSLGVLVGATPIVLEGATDDAFETTIAPTDPTADRTVTLPDAGGAAVLSPAGVQGTANAVAGVNNGFEYEGATANDFETTITVTDPTADRAITFPDAAGVPILASAVPEAANAVSGAANAIVYEGASADDFETTVVVTDPVSDITVTFPQYTGDLPIIVGQDAVSHSQAGTGTADGSSWTIPANTLAVGTALRITAGGTLTGGTAAPTVHLYIDNAQIVSLTANAATAGDWYAEFIIMEHTDTANQKCLGKLRGGAGATYAADYAIDTTDTTAAFVVKLQVESANAGDTIVQEMGILEFLP